MPVTLQPNPVPADLVSSARAQENATLAALATSNAAYFASLVSAASDAIRRECHRDFTVAAYSEYHSGSPNQRVLRLRQFPVVAITRLATAAPALCVTNDGSAAQRATVATTDAGLTLFSVSSGVASITTLLYATYPTLAALAAAISALGTGWSARALSGSAGPFANWPAADLKPTQGALTVLAGGATLEVYEDFGGGAGGAWPADDAIDASWSDAPGAPGGWRLEPETGELFGYWPRGRLNIRVDYSAGFVTVPDAVQEACVQLAADLYSQSQLSGTVLRARLGSASYTLNITGRTLARGPKIAGLIAPYIAYDKVMGR